MARWIQPTTRARIVERDSATCAYCGRAHLTVGETPSGCKPADDAATLDHIVPQKASIARGERPDNRPQNLVVACGHCNSSRHDVPIATWCRQVAERRLGQSGGAAVEELAAAIRREIRNRTRRALPTARRAA